MTFPAGPPVDFSDLRAEFGGTTGNDLGDYVRGGAFVPDIAQNNGIPTSPPLSLGQFYGSVNTLLINPGTQNYSHRTTNPPDSQAISGIRIGDPTADGDLEERDGNSYANRSRWLTAGSNEGDYEASCTIDSSNTTVIGSPTNGSFIGCELVPQWRIVDSSTSGGVLRAVLTIIIRHKVNTSDLITFQVDDLDAQVTL